MGYEIRLHIGQSIHSDNFSEIARVDLSKIGSGPLSHIIAFGKGKSVPIEFSDFKFLRDIKGKHLGVDDPITSEFFDIGLNYEFCGIYEGVEKVTEDAYGDPLPRIPLDHMIAAIEEELKVSTYRRFKLAKNILSEFKSQEWNSDIYVVPFGH